MQRRADSARSPRDSQVNPPGYSMTAYPKRSHRLVAALVGASACWVLPQLAQAQSLAPPPADLQDPFGVNMASGQVAPSLTDVSIGPTQLGLSHSISSFSSNFVNWDGSGPLGFRDKFYGAAIKVLHHKPTGVGAWVYTVRVFDVGDSFDFRINGDGTYTAYNGDTRNTLEFVPGTGLLWTKADGTVDTFGAGMTSYNPDISGYAWLNNIVYPNGFTLTFWGQDPQGGVTTNTGYQLKYVYVQDSSVPDNDDPTNDEIPPAGAIGWSHSIPKYVVAINNTVDYCNPGGTSFYASVADACPNMSRTWPTASYEWPHGMPRGMYLADASFKVTDASGKVTEYMHHPYTKPAVLNDPKFRAPRIVGIKSGNRSTPYVTYDYVSQTQQSGYSMLPIYVAGPIAQLSSATMDGQTVGYTVAQTYQYEGNYINVSGAPYGISRVLYNGEYGMTEIVGWDRTVEREYSSVNRVKSIYQVAGGFTFTFGYDPNSTRQNVTTLTRNGLVVQTASYPADCANRKTCNEPTWTRDALGNQTDYEYDPASGQPTRIRKPADSNGIRPEIRNTYTPLYATYRVSALAMGPAPTPVYLLTRTRECIATATLADGSGCAGGSADEVVTDLDYGPSNGPNNLALRGETVTAYVNGTVQVRRTCYSYDVLGNRIGVTTPNAGLAACY